VNCHAELIRPSTAFCYVFLRHVLDRFTHDGRGRPSAARGRDLSGCGRPRRMTARSEGERGNDRGARPLRDPRWVQREQQWDLAGGTVEPGKTPAHVAARGARGSRARGHRGGRDLPLHQPGHQWPPAHLPPLTYRVHESDPSREVVLAPDEHDGFDWVTLDELLHYDPVGHLRATVETVLKADCVQQFLPVLPNATPALDRPILPKRSRRIYELLKRNRKPPNLARAAPGTSAASSP